MWLAALLLLAACAAPGAGSRAPTQTATLAPPTSTPLSLHDRQLLYVNSLTQQMPLDKKLAQLFVVEYLYFDPNHADLQAMFGQMGVGGVILYHALNIESVAQTSQLAQAMQAQAAIPLLVGVDEEGGGDDQTNHLFGQHPTAMDIGRSGDPAVAAQNATRIATELKQLGMNADFAPVVDVMGPDRLWLRSFSRSADVVAQMSVAQVDAYQAAGIMAFAKHFPGLGTATSNPHDGLPTISSPKDYIERIDFAPYRALMAHHPAMIMTTDLLMPAFDAKLAAELSPTIVTTVLRQEIGYEGVIVTDALYMGGITQSYSMPEAGVLSILAGNDMLEGPSNARELQAMIDALHKAVDSGRLTEARIDESVRRILLMKAEYGLLPAVKA